MIGYYVFFIFTVPPFTRWLLICFYVPFSVVLLLEIIFTFITVALWPVALLAKKETFLGFITMLFKLGATCVGIYVYFKRFP